MPLSFIVYTALIYSITARSKLRKVLLLAPSVCVFLFVYKISREPLNGFAPNSHGRRVWSPLGRVQGQRSKVKGQCHQGQKNGIFGPLGGLRVRFMFGKTSLSSNLLSCISIYSHFNSEYRFSEPHSA